MFFVFLFCFSLFVWFDFFMFVSVLMNRSAPCLATTVITIATTTIFVQ